MFRGTLVVKPDTKGRVVIPSRFRNVLEKNGKEGVVVTGHPDGYLILMLKRNYEELERKVRDLPDNGQHALYYKQVLIGMADDMVSFDKAGRMPLGSELRAHAGIDGDVAVVGMHDHIRLWSKDRLDKLYSSFRDNGGEASKTPDGWDGFTI